MINIYAIRDIKAEAYMTPFFARTHGEAIRMVETAVNDPKSGFHNYAADYTLYFIGEFDDKAGMVNGSKTPVHVQDLHTLKKETFQNSMAAQSRKDDANEN